MRASTSTRTLATALLLAGSPVLFAQGPAKQTIDVLGQEIGGVRTVVPDAEATLIRTDNGITALLTMPTPVSGSYNYPPAGSATQPAPVPGNPEVFTGWEFVFNNPAQCATPYQCSPADFANGSGMPSVYNFAGHAISGLGSLQFAGHVSLGQTPFQGAYPLSNPMGAEVHLAIAPHGVLLPESLPAEINTPIGTPPYWWVAIFSAP